MASANTTHPNNTARGVRTATVLAALASVVIGVTGCGQDNKSSSSSATIPTPLQEQASSGTAAPASAGDSTSAPPGVEGVDPLPQDRYLAIDVTFGIEVDDMAKGIDAVVALSDRHGGQIYERDINIADDRSSTASFVIKLPPKEVESAIADLDGIGTRRTASQGTEDVTSQVVDIDARLATAQASLDRVRKLLDSATDLGQILSLESELTDRETAVEKYEAMKRAVDERVSLATLRVHLSLDAAQPAAAHKTGIGKAFETGWHGFVTMLAAILIFFGYTAPFLVLVAIGAAVVIPIIRRRQRARRSRSTALPPPPARGEGQQTSEPDSVGAARSR